MVDFATAKHSATSISRLGPENDSLVVAGAREKLPTAAPSDRVHTSEVVVHLRKHNFVHIVKIGISRTWQSILGTLESFWSLGLRMGARFQTVTLGSWELSLIFSGKTYKSDSHNHLFRSKTLGIILVSTL